LVGVLLENVELSLTGDLMLSDAGRRDPQIRTWNKVRGLSH